MSPLDSLIASLNSLGQPTYSLNLSGSAQLLLLPHGGRVLGLFADNHSPNFFWTNPDLQTQGTQIFRSAWPNVGGDRTWLSPETEFFISNLTQPPAHSLDHWQVPPEIDPGNYSLNLADGYPQLSTTATFHLHHARAYIRARITKSFSPAQNPLQFHPSISYAGYTTHQSIEILDSPEKPGVALSLWTLLQLPHAGLALIATKSNCRPIRMFGNVPDDDLQSSDSCTAFHAQAQSIGKIGFPARSVTGRIGHLHQSDSTCNLIVRDFHVHPSKTYLDKPIINLQSEPCCVEICNYHTPTLTYIELEHHTPAIGFGAGSFSYTDSHQTWAYRGSAHEITRHTGRLLGTDAQKMARRFLAP